MYGKKDIADLLAEVQIIVHALRDEKSDLRDQVNGLETQLSMVKEEKLKEIRNLEDINTQLTKELQETQDRLLRELQDTQQKFDRFHPELQSIQDDLRNAEMQTHLLAVELSQKDEIIESLKSRLSEYTSLLPSSMAVEESISSN